MRILRARAVSPKELTTIFKHIQTALKRAPRNSYSAEVCIQIIKWAPELEGLRAQEFCEGTRIPLGYIADFSKMRKISQRLVASGFDVKKL